MLILAKLSLVLRASRSSGTSRIAAATAALAAAPVGRARLAAGLPLTLWTAVKPAEVGTVVVTCVVIVTSSIPVSVIWTYSFTSTVVASTSVVVNVSVYKILG